MIIPASISLISIVALVALDRTHRKHIAELQGLVDSFTATRKLANTVADFLDDSEWSKRSESVIREKIPALTDENIATVMAEAGAVRYTKRDGTPMWGIA